MGACEIKIVGIAHHSPGDNVVYLDIDNELVNATISAIVIEQTNPKYFSLYYRMTGLPKPIPADRVWSNEKEYKSHLKYMELTK
jgi:hypothetical protein